MYTHGGRARRGLGRLILGTCERSARDAAFTRAELLATLAGEPLYLAFGWHEIARTALPTSIGVDVPAIRMGKRLVVRRQSLTRMEHAPDGTFRHQ